MKKPILLTLISFLITTPGFSQNLSLSDSTGPIANNGTIIVEAPIDSTKLLAHVNVTNNSSSTIKVICKKEYIYIVPGTTNSFCWGGACLPPGSFVSGPYSITPGTTVYGGISDGFEGDYFPEGNPGTSTIRYTFFNETDTTDAVSVIVQYSVTVGLEELISKIKFSGAYPNPATNQVTFEYSLPEGVSETIIVIRDILGNTVKQNMITNKEGKIVINTENLTSGLYFYSLVVNGKIALSKKLIINR